jgi:hypothetical protein
MGSTATIGLLGRPNGASPTPPQEDRRVPKPIALQVVVLHFRDALRADRLPRQILPGAPAALATGHACRPVLLRVFLSPPRVTVERISSERRQLTGEFLASRQGERGGHPNVVQSAAMVI